MRKLAPLTVEHHAPPAFERALFRFEGRSTFEDGRVAIEKALVVLRAYEHIENEQEEIHARLCLDEAVSNAIKHGNRMDPARRFLVQIAPVRGGWAARIEDEGTGFEPETLPDPLAQVESDHGRGIFLIRNFMDRLIYYRHPAGSGLQIEKHKTPTGEAH